MLSALKPSKSNVVGTVLLLVANLIGSAASRFAFQLIPRDATAGAAAGYAGRGAAGAPQFGGLGLMSGAVNYVILAILFYIVISFVVAKLGGPKEEEKAEGGAKRTGNAQAK